MAELQVENLKALREALCLGQGSINYAFNESDWAIQCNHELQKLIDQIDVLRPIGSDGVHGDLHTEWCGCEDREPFPQGL